MWREPSAGYAHCGPGGAPWISSKLSTLGVTRLRGGRRARALTARRDFSVDGRRPRIHSEQLLPRALLGILCTAGSGASSPSPVVRPAPLRWFSPTQRKAGEPWTNNPPPRASSWQIAGVWISAAALRIAARQGSHRSMAAAQERARDARPCEEAGVG